MQQQEDRFQVKEVKMKKKLKTVETKVGKKTKKRIMRQMQKYFEDLRASSLSLLPPRGQRYRTRSLYRLLFLRLPRMIDKDSIPNTNEQEYS